MEINFKSQLLIDLYEGRNVKEKEFNSNKELVKQYIKTVGKLKAAQKIEQLFQFAGLNYEKLKGSLKGKSSVRINKQFRLIFEEITDGASPPVVILLNLEEISKHYQ
jgi:proteic killer suppression protein